MSNPVLTDQQALLRRYVVLSPLTRAQLIQFEQIKDDKDVDKLATRYRRMGYGSGFAKALAEQLVPRITLVKSNCAKCDKGGKTCRFNDELCQLEKLDKAEAGGFVWSFYERIAAHIDDNSKNRDKLKAICDSFDGVYYQPFGQKLSLLVKGEFNQTLLADFEQKLKSFDLK